MQDKNINSLEKILKQFIMECDISKINKSFKVFRSYMEDYLPKYPAYKNISLSLYNIGFLKELLNKEHINKIKLHNYINNLILNYGYDRKLTQQIINVWINIINQNININKKNDESKIKLEGEIRLFKTNPLLISKNLENFNFYRHINNNVNYLNDKLVVLNEKEVKAYKDAANELYGMFVKAGDYIIKNNLFHEFGIPFNLIEIIKESWKNVNIHRHIYGCFDFAGGIGGKPIKLIEFNADIPTYIIENAIIQVALLKSTNLKGIKQFNFIYKSLIDSFRSLVKYDLYDNRKFLFSSIKENIEEENTIKFLQYIATLAGYNTEFAFVDEVKFDENGIYFNEEKYKLWFKLISWEDIAIDEPNLAMSLKNIIKNKYAIIFNPAYTIMFQNKAILKLLWDLYPNHPLLLETSFEPLKNKTQVKKPIYGRNGGDISIIDKNGFIKAKNKSEYSNYKMIYQEYIELPKDHKGYYQAEIFYINKACGIGFRRGDIIINNTSKFVGHIIL